MRLSEGCAPVASPNGKNAELGDDDGGTDSGSDFLGRLDTETNVPLGVSNDDDSLEPSSLTGTSLLLDGLDLEGEKTRDQQRFPLSSPFTRHRLNRSHLHNFILKLGQEKVDDLVLLDGQGVQVDLLHALDLAGLDQTTKFGDWLPFLLLVLVGTTTGSTTSTATTSAVTTTISTRSESSARASSSGSATSCVSHIVRVGEVVRVRRIVDAIDGDVGLG